jgi:hypothetical protein
MVPSRSIEKNIEIVVAVRMALLHRLRCTRCCCSQRWSSRRHASVRSTTVVTRSHAAVSRGSVPLLPMTRTCAPKACPPAPSTFSKSTGGGAPALRAARRFATAACRA